MVRIDADRSQSKGKITPSHLEDVVNEVTRLKVILLSAGVDRDISQFLAERQLSRPALILGKRDVQQPEDPLLLTCQLGDESLGLASRSG